MANILNTAYADKSNGNREMLTFARVVDSWHWQIREWDGSGWHLIRQREENSFAPIADMFQINGFYF